MRKHFSLLISGLMFGLIASCGGSSSDETTAADFSLVPPGYFSLGFEESYDISGSDTQGQTYSGTYTSQTQAETLFDGTSAIPIVATLGITNNQTGARISTTTTGFFSVDDTSFELLGTISDTVSIASASPVEAPLRAQIGDFGTMGSYVFNDGNKQVVSWRLEAAEDGNANYVELATTTDQNEAVVNVSEISQQIDPSGNRLSAELRIAFVDSGVTLTLNGVKN